MRKLLFVKLSALLPGGDVGLEAIGLPLSTPNGHVRSPRILDGARAGLEGRSVAPMFEWSCCRSPPQRQQNMEGNHVVARLLKGARA